MAADDFSERQRDELDIIKAHPISRLRNYMVRKNWWDEKKEEDWKKKSKTKVMESFAKAEKKLKPDWRYMFTDVYEKMTPNLKRQMAEMESHVSRYEDHYPVQNYAKKPGPIEE